MSSKPRHSFFGSLLFRLTLLYTAVFSLALGGIYILLATLLTTTAIQQTDRMILGEAGRMLDLASRRKASILQAEMDRFIFHYGSNEVAVTLYGTNGITLARSERPTWHADIPPPPTNNTNPIFTDTITRSGNQIRTVVASDDSGYTLCVSALVDGQDQPLQQSQRALAIALISSLLLGTTLAFLLTRRTLARIEHIRVAAEAMTKGAQGARVENASGGDEVAALSATFNHMLDRIDLTLDELRHVTDNMAHDLRTPLTRIRASAESALIDNSTPTQQAEALAAVLEECSRLERMTGTLLQISRMTSGNYNPTRDLCSINELIQEAVELMEPAFQDKQIGLQLTIPSTPLTVSIDRPVVERVIANLLDNALKFTPPGGSVGVEASRQDALVRIKVSDTGSGIAADELPRIFKRFHRADATQHVSGLGLGLSFVQAAIQAHGGSVSVTSTVGMGSVFMISLPLSTSA